MNSTVTPIRPDGSGRIDISYETAVLYRYDTESRLMLIIDNRRALSSRVDDAMWDWADAAASDLGYDISRISYPDITIGPVDFYFLEHTAP